MAAVGRYGECLALVSRHITDRLLDAPDKIMCQEMTADLYVLRARIHAKFGNVSSTHSKHWCLSQIYFVLLVMMMILVCLTIRAGKNLGLKKSF